MIDDIPIRILGAITILLTNTVTAQPVHVDYEAINRPGLEIHKPEHPEKRPIRKYLSDYGVTHDIDDYVDDLVDVSSRYGVDPRIIVAIYILESSAGRYCYRFNCYGWAGGSVGFGSHREALEAVGETIAKYKARGVVETRDIMSVWRTGGLNDSSEYPSKAMKIIQSI